MTAMQVGRPAASVRATAQTAPLAPPHYLRRVARLVVLRAAVKGRLSWLVALMLLRYLEVGQ